MQLSSIVKTTIIIVYGPGEDETVLKKDEFQEKLTETLEYINGRWEIVMSDLNGSIGWRDKERAIGTRRSYRKNIYRKQLIDFCIVNNLITTNSFFGHKGIHKFTRKVQNIINKQYRSESQDTRVKRYGELYSDHYLEVVKIKINMTRETGRNNNAAVINLQTKSKS